MNKVLVSYKSVDKEAAQVFIERLNSVLKESCVPIEDDGKNDPEKTIELVSVLNESAIIIVLYSCQYEMISDYTTDWTIRELNYMQETEKRIVFVSIDGTPLSKWFTFMFPQQEMIDIRMEESVAQMLAELPEWLSTYVPPKKVVAESAPELIYAYDLATHEAAVCGIRNNYSFMIIIPSVVNHDGVEYKVTSIRHKAFCNNHYINSVHLPPTIRSIGRQAFMNCKQLSFVELNEGLISIGTSAFYGCEKLKTEVPSTVRKIGLTAFLWTENTEKENRDRIYLAVSISFGILFWVAVIYLIVRYA